jgi:hypothetical protein
MELAQVVRTKLLLVKRLYYASHVGGFFFSKLSFLEWAFYVASTGSPPRMNIPFQKRVASTPLFERYCY